MLLKQNFWTQKSHFIFWTIFFLKLTETNQTTILQRTLCSYDIKYRYMQIQVWTAQLQFHNILERMCKFQHYIHSYTTTILSLTGMLITPVMMGTLVEFFNTYTCKHTEKVIQFLWFSKKHYNSTQTLQKSCWIGFQSGRVQCQLQWYLDVILRSYIDNNKRTWSNWRDGQVRQTLC